MDLAHQNHPILRSIILERTDAELMAPKPREIALEHIRTTVSPNESGMGKQLPIDVGILSGLIWRTLAIVDTRIHVCTCICMQYILRNSMSLAIGHVFFFVQASKKTRMSESDPTIL